MCVRRDAKRCVTNPPLIVLLLYEGPAYLTLPYLFAVDLLADPQIWIAFFTLLALEIVLGIDNVVFISILAAKLPEHQRSKARNIGLSLALIMRIILLFSLSWVIGLTGTVFSLFGQDFSGRDLILIVGGAFLLVKATLEIHERLEGDEAHAATGPTATFAGVIVQILLLDAVFSLDSVITAVGMVDELPVMIAAVTVAILLMLLLAGTISRFVDKHPTVKMLALAFLVLIGATLVGEGFDVETPKGYIYGPIAFAILVEGLNLRYKTLRARNKPVHSEPVHLRPAILKENGQHS